MSLGFTCSQGSGELLPAVSQALRKSGLLSKSKPVEISDMAFAVAVLGNTTEDVEFLELLAARASPENNLDEFTSRQLVTMLWAFAR